MGSSIALVLLKEKPDLELIRKAIPKQSWRMFKEVDRDFYIISWPDRAMPRKFTTDEPWPFGIAAQPFAHLLDQSSAARFFDRLSHWKSLVRPQLSHEFGPVEQNISGTIALARLTGTTVFSGYADDAARDHWIVASPDGKVEFQYLHVDVSDFEELGHREDWEHKEYVVVVTNDSTEQVRTHDTCLHQLLESGCSAFLGFELAIFGGNYEVNWGQFELIREYNPRGLLGWISKA